MSETKTGDSRVAGYFRVSQARDGMRAPDMYTEEIERYCRYRDLRLAEIFSDIDYSGYRGARSRPALEDLTARRYEFSSIIVPKLARFGRSVKDLVALFDLFDRDGIALVFLDMNIDTSTSHGRLLRHIMAAFAEYESDVKSDYARANHRMVRAQGRPWGGRPPFGYERDPNERSYVIHPARAEIVRRIFTDYLAGASQYELRRRLNEARQVRPSGRPWSDQCIGRILDNPAYAALCIVEDDFVEGVWKPIVERPVWDAVRARRAGDKRRRRMLRTSKGGPYLLSGMLYCGVCGGKLSHRTSNGRPSGIYVCIKEENRWCTIGSIDCERADRYVSERFLDRCQFIIQGRSDTTFEENRRAWDRASVFERRRLLSMAIRKVVLSLGGGPSSLSRQRNKQLDIEWTGGVRADSSLALIAEADQPATDRPKVSEGRAEMMRDLENAKARAKREGRSQRARTYYAEWKQVQKRLLRS